MAYLFSVFMNRGLTPEKGQEYLEQMVKVIDDNSKPIQLQPGSGQPAPTAQTVKIPGVNTFGENNTPKGVFPDWLAESLQQVGLVYDTINLCFYRHFPTEQEALQAMNRFDQQFRPWMLQVHPEAKELVDNVHVRIMDETLDTGDSRTF
jgi:hypothetical protein